MFLTGWAVVVVALVGLVGLGVIACLIGSYLRWRSTPAAERLRRLGDSLDDPR